MPMQILTRVACPHCQTELRLNEKQMARPQMPCFHCKQSFTPAQHVLQDPAQTAPDNELELLLAEELDELPPSRPGRVLPTVFALLLVATLVGQYYWFMQRDQVLQHPQLRGLLELACASLECALPPTRAPAQVTVVRHHMGKHETVADAVLVQILFENGAEFPQAYPYLQIRFLDENERTVASRRFSPEEYLDTPETARQPMAPHQTVHVKLEFRDAVEKMASYGFLIEFI